MCKDRILKKESLSKLLKFSSAFVEILFDEFPVITYAPNIYIMSHFNTKNRYSFE